MPRNPIHRALTICARSCLNATNGHGRRWAVERCARALAEQRGRTEPDRAPGRAGDAGGGRGDRAAGRRMTVVSTPALVPADPVACSSLMRRGCSPRAGFGWLGAFSC
jgi:hypothetical protein